MNPKWWKNKYMVNIVLQDNTATSCVVVAPTQAMAQAIALHENKIKQYKTCQAERIEDE